MCSDSPVLGRIIRHLDRKLEAAMAENGEEKLIAVVRHIAKSLGNNDDMTDDDVLNFFSNFDGRLREKPTDDGGEQTLNSLDRQISRYLAYDSAIWSNSVDSAAFLAAVDQLIAALQDWTPLADDKSISPGLDRAEDLLHQAMLRLQDEFRTLVERGAESFGESTRPDLGYSDDEFAEEDEDFIPVAEPVTDYDILINALPAGTVGELHEIVKRMVAAGYVKECSHAYSTCRRKFLEESFSRLGLPKLTTADTHMMQWTQQEDEIDKWIKAINVALRILFPSERRMCDRVFFGLPSAADLSFMEVCRVSTIQLLNFADAVAIRSRAPERLFKVLDVYETVRDLMPEFELNFSDQYCVSLRNEAITIWKRLGEAIRGIFMELENLTRRDPAKTAVPGGGLHPITRYVINYLLAACRSRQTLEQVFEGSLVPPGTAASSLAVQMAWIVELLESNLEAKSKVYRDSALCSIFMMNNGKYIGLKVKDSELEVLLGENWIRKHAAKVRQYQVNYQRSSWSKVVGVLKGDNTTTNNNNSTSPNDKALKEKLKLFNSYLEEVCETQSSWVALDDQLRDELRGWVLGTVCLAYRNFITRLQAAPDMRKNGIRYSVEDVEVRVKELFRGPR